MLKPKYPSARDRIVANVEHNVWLPISSVTIQSETVK